MYISMSSWVAPFLRLRNICNGILRTVSFRIRSRTSAPDRISLRGFSWLDIRYVVTQCFGNLLKMPETKFWLHLNNQKIHLVTVVNTKHRIHLGTTLTNHFHSSQGLWMRPSLVFKILELRPPINFLILKKSCIEC